MQDPLKEWRNSSGPHRCPTDRIDWHIYQMVQQDLLQLHINFDFIYGGMEVNDEYYGFPDSIIRQPISLSATQNFKREEQTLLNRVVMTGGSVAEQRTKREGVDTERVHNVMPSAGR
ncbi:hypothetical protein TNCV_2557871 [Trichonephila clavipes]|nr:hypothetical protein TNCV_2557871 [Trichonephila clavipes]